MALTLQFLSVDDKIQADCQSRALKTDIYDHVAIFIGHHLERAHAAMLRASRCELVEGRYVRYAGDVYRPAAGDPMEVGPCLVGVFPTAGDRDAFALLSGAHPAQFARAIAQPD